jgi:UDPglucose 6-dehydrogenase
MKLEDTSVSIIGAGYVGRALYHGFSPVLTKVFLYDKYSSGFNTFEETVNGSFIIFLCLPTPTDMKTGSQDLSILESVIKELPPDKVVIIKSTVLPGTTRSFQEKYPQHIFVFNPEFLTERTYIFDFLNQSRIILGSDHQAMLNLLENLYRFRFPHTPILKTTSETAEVIKYVCNCYFASKVSFLNEVYEICKKVNISYEDVKVGFLGDQRIANSHTLVPGPDGDFGFGGKCFPKDLKSFVSWGKNLGLNMTLFEATEKVNERVRKVKNWENIKGATTENNFGD